MRLHPLTKATLLALSSGLVVACGGDDDDDDTAQDDGAPQAEVRVVHASSNAPNVNAGLNGGDQVSDLAFADATGFLSVDEGDYDVTVDAIKPDGESTIDGVTSASDVPLSADNETSIFAVGDVFGSDTDAISALPVTAPDADPASDEVRVQVVHASNDAAGQDLDVFLTKKDADLTVNTDEKQLGSSFTYKGTIGPETITTGSSVKRQIRVTPKDEPGKVIFDSGEIPLNGGSDLTIAAIDNTGPSSNTAPIRLLVIPEGGNPSILRDQDSNTDLRAAHLSSNADDLSSSGVDVTLDGTKKLDDFPFGNLSNFLNEQNGTYSVEVQNADDSNTSPVVGPIDLTLEPQSFNTAYAINDGNGGVTLDTTAKDDLRSVATEARVRVYHGAQNATSEGSPDGKVDVYVLSKDDKPMDPANAAIDSLAFKDLDEASVDGSGSQKYDIWVTTEDNASNDVIGPVTIDPSNGDVYTVIARDDGSDGFTVTSNKDRP